MPQPLEPQSPRQRLADCATLRSFGGRAGPGSLSGLGSCLRRYIVARVAFTAAIGVFEALLFAMLGSTSTGWPGWPPPALGRTNAAAC